MFPTRQSTEMTEKDQKNIAATPLKFRKRVDMPF